MKKKDAMEKTMAATPKARLAESTSEPGPLAFPVPPPARNAPVQAAFAYPQPAPIPTPVPWIAPMPSSAMRVTRRTTARVPRDARPSVDSLAGIASWIETAPLPALPDGAWAFLGRAWFFIAGTTMGILLALALVAVAGSKRPTPRAAHAVTSDGNARVLVIQRASTVGEKGIGELAENDVVVESAPAPASIARRPVIAARRSAVRRAGTKDILSAGL